jgi:hypothetical protein
MTNGWPASQAPIRKDSRLLCGVFEGKRTNSFDDAYKNMFNAWNTSMICWRRFVPGLGFRTVLIISYFPPIFFALYLALKGSRCLLFVLSSRKFRFNLYARILKPGASKYEAVDLPVATDFFVEKRKSKDYNAFTGSRIVFYK